MPGLRHQRCASEYVKATTIVLVTALAIVVCDIALAQSTHTARPRPLVLTDDQGRYPMGLHLELLNDPSGELTIEDITSPEYDSRFVSSDVEVPNLGYTDGAYWARARLSNEATSTEQWLLELAYANTHFVDFYTPSPDGNGYDVTQTGILRDVRTRDLRYHNLVFDLRLPDGGDQPVYLRVQNGAAISLPLILWRPTDFLAHSGQTQAIHFAYFGILLGLLVYNLFLLGSLRESSYLYLVLFLANFIFFEIAYLGYLECCIAPAIYSLRGYYFPLSFSLIFVTMLLFADTFLELAHLRLRLHKLTLAISVFWAVPVLMIPFYPYRVLAIAMLSWALVSLTFLLATGVLTWMQGFRPARYYVIAWFGLAVAFMLVLNVRFAIVPSTVVTENAYRIGLVWVAVCWSLALADRIDMLKSNLQGSEHRLTQILEGLPLGVVVYGTDQKPTYANRRVRDILSNPLRGIEPDISAGRTLAEALEYFSFRIKERDQRYPLKQFPITLALGGESSSADDVEADLVDRRVPLEIWASPVMNDQGQVESAVVAFQDITQRRAVEIELAQYRTHLEHLVAQRTDDLRETNAQLGREVSERKQLADLQARLIAWLSEVNEIQQLLGGTADLPMAHEKLLVALIGLTGARMRSSAYGQARARKRQCLAVSARKERLDRYKRCQSSARYAQRCEQKLFTAEFWSWQPTVNLRCLPHWRRVSPTSTSAR